MHPRRLILLAVAAVIVVPLAVAWLNVLLSAIRRGVPTTCPDCRSGRIRPSWPGLIEKTFPRFVHVYRCESCQKRFYARRAPWVRDAVSR